jgi:hypothetical protein
MLVSGPFSAYSFTFDNFGANPAATGGGLVTAGGSINTESTTPLVLATGAQLTQDVYWIEVLVHGTSGTGDRQMLLDIGVDPAGGTSYTWIISNIVVGNTPIPPAGGVGFHFLFPFYIKSGSQVACRTQCNQISITARVMAKFYGQPSNPEIAPRGAFSETIGTITNSQGVGFTPGNAADGTWQLLVTATKSMWWWQVAFSVNNATITAETAYVDLAFGDGSNKHLIIRAQHFGTTSETCCDLLAANMSFLQAYKPVPAGASLYIRGRANNAPDTGYNGVAVGIGG